MSYFTTTNEEEFFDVHSVIIYTLAGFDLTMSSVSIEYYTSIFALLLKVFLLVYVGVKIIDRVKKWAIFNKEEDEQS